MKRMNLKKHTKKRTILFIVFFCLALNSLILFHTYSKYTNKKIPVFINQALDKIIYQFFTDLITDNIINKENVSNILDITKNNEGEILAVNYNLEKTYALLTEVSNILKEGISDLENGKIDVKIYDKYIDTHKSNLVLNIPLFLGSKNVFLNNIGPVIPIAIRFNETLLTNIKTKVTNYGFNNALLEVYITVELQKLIISPVIKDKNKFNYDILVASLVVNGSVPDFYGDEILSASAILDIPKELAI